MIRHFVHAVKLAKPGAYEDILLSCVILAQVLLTIPISYVLCERGFSAQNRIHGALRNKMSPNAVECKMHIVHACKAPLDEKVSVKGQSRSSKT